MAFPREELIPYLKVVFPITSIILDFSLTLVAYLAPYNSPFPVNSLVKVLLSPQSGDSPILYFGAFGYLTCQGTSCTQRHATRLWDLTAIPTTTAEMLQMPIPLRLLLLEASIMWPVLFMISTAILYLSWFESFKISELVQTIVFYCTWIIWGMGVTTWVAALIWFGKTIYDTGMDMATTGSAFSILLALGCVTFIQLAVLTVWYTQEFWTENLWRPWGNKNTETKSIKEEV